MNGAKILVTGGRGLLGASLVRRIRESFQCVVMTPSRQELDLLNGNSVSEYLNNSMPDYVFHLAAYVNGLGGNIANPIDSLEINDRINLNLLSAINFSSSVKKVFFAGTVASYGYPFERLPLVEGDIFKGEPHIGEYGYAASKRHAYAYLSLIRSEKKYLLFMVF